MDVVALKQYLTQIGQVHLSEGVDTLSPDERSQFFKQLEQFGVPTLDNQRSILAHHAPIVLSDLEPTPYRMPTGQEDRKRGEELIAEGKVGCILLAGGQGTRLGLNIPKGMAKISPVKHKSLFQIFCERTLVCSKKMNVKLPLAIMTSSSNHKETLAYLEHNRFFGLEEEQVSLFCQEDLPLLSEKGDWMLLKPGELAVAANGNGDALTLFYRSGLFTKWQKRGVEFISLVQVDNPLADPFDAESIGIHAKSSADVTIKSIYRRDKEEKLGLVVCKKGKTMIVEYSDIAPSDFSASIGKQLKFPLGNTGLFYLSLPFIESFSQKEKSLPWHLAKKEQPVFQNGKMSKMRVWKFERFIFDILPWAQSIEVVVYPRESCYSPLKNAQGDKSLFFVQRDMQEYDRKKFFTLTGHHLGEGKIELSTDFYYPTDALLEQIKGKSGGQTGYIEPQAL